MDNDNDCGCSCGGFPDWYYCVQGYSCDLGYDKSECGDDEQYIESVFWEESCCGDYCYGHHYNCCDVGSFSVWFYGVWII